MNILYPILYEDANLLVIDKPAGLASNALPQGNSPSAEAELRTKHPNLHLLHRLDPGTSGCLAFAKSESARDFYRGIWTTGEVLKFYRAVVDGDPGFGSLPVSLVTPIAHHAKSAKRMVPVTPELLELAPRAQSLRFRGEPRPATTKVLSVSPRRGGATEILVQILTGVRHQIRVHLREIGHPILGDTVYGGPEFPRLCLHAERLIVPDPTSGASIEVTAGPPADWPA
jgi:23S rRNA-/tRNA-specific pseudouridylate synthase